MFPLGDENPAPRFPVVTCFLIVITALVFGYELSLRDSAEDFILAMGLIPTEVVLGMNLPLSAGPPPFVTLFTSLFLHGGPGHLIGNLWFLWIFGDNVEGVLGRFRFLIFYFATGIFAGLVHVWLNPFSSVPTIGASGAISGLLGAYLVLFPRVRIRTLVFLGFFVDVLRVPAALFLVVWFALQTVGAHSAGSQEIAFGAHIGGFIAGMFFALPMRHQIRRSQV